MLFAVLKALLILNNDAKVRGYVLSAKTFCKNFCLDGEKFLGGIMDKKERINKVFEYLRFSGVVKTQADMACAMGASRSNISSALSGKTDVLTDSFLERVARTFGINEMWLLYGEGEMLKPTTNSATINAPNHGLIAVGNGNTNTLNTTTPATETEEIPEAEVAVIPTELYKDPNTNLYQYTEVNDVETQPIVHQFSPHDRFYRVINSSMSPKLLASDVVALQRVDINDSIPGCVYMIDHRTKGSFLRKVTDQGDSLLLTSYNKEDYPDFTVYKKDVLNLARVVGLIRTDI